MDGGDDEEEGESTFMNIITIMSTYIITIIVSAVAFCLLMCVTLYCIYSKKKKRAKIDGKNDEHSLENIDEIGHPTGVKSSNPQLAQAQCAAMA